MFEDIFDEILELPSTISTSVQDTLPDSDTLRNLIDAGCTVAELSDSTGLAISVIESILDSD